MVGASAELHGWPELSAALDNLTPAIEREVQQVLDVTGLKLRGDIIKDIQRSPATGKTYRKYSPNRTHRASAPGEPPASDTGRLANSIVFKSDGRLSVSVGSDLAYAAYLEFGTSRMAPRPAWTPAVENERKPFYKRLEEAVARGMKNA